MTRIDVRQPASGGGGGGASTPPGQAAHYIGTWDVAVAYAAGECVRQWDGSEFKLYQAKKATTGDDPTSVVASWAEVTTPIVMWGAEDPNLTDSVNIHGGGIVAPFQSVYLWTVPFPGLDPGPGILTFADREDSLVQGVGLWDAGTYVRIRDTDGATSYLEQANLRSGTGSGDAFSTYGVHNSVSGSGSAYLGLSSNRHGDGNADAVVDVSKDSGTGDTRAQLNAFQGGTSIGDANANLLALVADTATGTARATTKATHHAGTEAHVVPTATATGAFNNVKGDLVFTDNTEGTVLHDQSDGHTYRIVSTAGVLSTVQVT